MGTYDGLVVGFLIKLDGREVGILKGLSVIGFNVGNFKPEGIFVGEIEGISEGVIESLFDGVALGAFDGEKVVIVVAPLDRARTRAFTVPVAFNFTEFVRNVCVYSPVFIESSSKSLVTSESLLGWFDSKVVTMVTFAEIAKFRDDPEVNFLLLPTMHLI